MFVHKKAFLVFSIVFLSLFPVTVSADMGPKPKLTVIVKNPPEDEYYLDLLVNYDLPLCDNLTEPIKVLDKEKIELLTEYNENGWYSVLVHGTRYTVWGKLTGEPCKEGRKHTFGYFGLPDQYKIMIVTPENKVIVTRTILKKSYVSVVTYDYETGEVIEDQGISLAWTCIKQFLMSFVCTLILESVVLLLFRFKTTHVLRVFFMTNLITQVFMTFVLSTALLMFGIFASYVVLLGVEIVIAITEAIVYTSLFKEGTKTKRVAYAITANLISGLAMLPLMYLEYLLFLR